MKNSQEYKDARDKAYKESGHNAYFGNGFGKGYDFAMAQPKHIFDGVAQVGEVRRFECNFNGNVKCVITYSRDGLIFEKGMDGWGRIIDNNNVTIAEITE